MEGKTAKLLYVDPMISYIIKSTSRFESEPPKMFVPESRHTTQIIISFSERKIREGTF